KQKPRTVPPPLSELPGQPCPFHSLLRGVGSRAPRSHRSLGIRLTSSCSEGAGPVQPLCRTAFSDPVWGRGSSSHIPSSPPPRRASSPTSRSCILGRNSSPSRPAHFPLHPQGNCHPSCFFSQNGCSSTGEGRVEVIFVLVFPLALRVPPCLPCLASLNAVVSLTQEPFLFLVVWSGIGPWLPCPGSVVACPLKAPFFLTFFTVSTHHVVKLWAGVVSPALLLLALVTGRPWSPELLTASATISSPFQVLGSLDSWVAPYFLPVVRFFL
ncbi:hypothetical protein MC885_005464, partial [Smutsia gigantea]